jgi:hypothetical protein
MKWIPLKTYSQSDKKPSDEPSIEAPTTEQIKALQLSDVFTAATRAHRRNLMIASSGAVLLTLGGEHFTTTFFIKLGDSSSLSIATGALWIVAFYECECFIAYGVRDLKGWQLNLFLKLIEYERLAVQELRKRVETIDANITQIAYNASTAKVDLADVLKNQTPLPSGTFKQLIKLT